MLLTRLARFQLAIFGVVTVICLALITTSYLHLPAAVGLGVYNVDAKFVVGGGIYQNANVTYRGVTVGRVTNVGLTDNGVTARMRLNTDTPVPDNVTATVKSVSAIGEQYIDLVPPAGASKNMLKGGATIGASFTVRKISFGEGVERVFPLYSTNIDSIEVVRRGRVRRAKLYYLRSRRGKSARIAEVTNYKEKAE